MIKYVDSETLHIIHHPDDIKSGRSFIVLKTNFKRYHMNQIFLGNKTTQIAAINKDERIGILFRTVNYNTNPPIKELEPDDIVIWFGDLESLGHLNTLIIALIAKWGKVVEL